MLLKRSFSLSGHRTSVALEPEFWATLETMAADRDLPLAALVASLDASRQPGDPLASLLRVSALRHVQGHAMPVSKAPPADDADLVKEFATKSPA